MLSRGTQGLSQVPLDTLGASHQVPRGHTQQEDINLYSQNFKMYEPHTINYIFPFSKEAKQNFL